MKYLLPLLGIQYIFSNPSYDAVTKWNPSQNECSPWELCKPTIISCYICNPEDDANKLHNAFLKKTGASTEIINIITKRSLNERWEIFQKFQIWHGDKLDFFKSIENHLKGDNLKKLVLSLFKSLEEFYAEEINEAIKSWFTKYSSIIDILGTLSNKGRKAVVDKFDKRFKITFSDAIDKEASPCKEFEKLLKDLAEQKRPENRIVDENLVLQDVQTLITAELQWKTNLSEFSEMIISRSTAHLEKVCEVFNFFTKHSLEVSLARGYDEKYRNGLIALAKIAQNRNKYFAERLYESLNRFPLFIDHDTVIRTLVGRPEIDMENIKESFAEIYGQSLATILRRKTSGDYQLVLLKLIGEESIAYELITHDS